MAVSRALKANIRWCSVLTLVLVGCKSSPPPAALPSPPETLVADSGSAPPSDAPSVPTTPPLPPSSDGGVADGLYRVVPAGHMGSKSVTAMRGASPTLVDITSRIHVDRALLFAEDNGNTRFQLMAWYKGKPPEGEGVLVVGSEIVMSSGYGSDSNGLDMDFSLTPAQATAVAALLKTPRQDRHLVGDLVTGSFALSAKSYRPGQSVDIALTLTNPAGAPPIKYTQGGRNRGPRDNQFSFTIRRNGTALAPVQAMDFGGLSSMPDLSPGGTAAISAPLKSWGDLSLPGHYEVDCRWETTLSPAGIDPYDDLHRGAIWDRAFDGMVAFDVR